MRIRFLAAFTGLFFFFSVVAPLQAAPLREYEIKAAFLYQFTKFVEWPQNALSDGTYFNLCVVGNNPFGRTLQQLEKEMVHRQRVQIRYWRNHDFPDSCQIVFVSASERRRLAGIIGKFKGKGVLTVGEVPGFLEQGGLINFVRQEKNIRFQINQREAESSGIKISSKLLSLAERVVT